ncbi:MAG: ribonuclease D [Woeseiaceae bacterium]
MPDNNKTQYEIFYVDTEEKLQQLCEQIQDAPILVIDTEFVREKTYRARLCLLQLATEDVVACIDPIALNNITPLMKIINDKNKIKVLHAARQDYEIFYDLCSELPSPLFDSQIAASLLGYGEQVGYGALVAKILNIQLDKAHTRTDWSKRPLSQAQINYACDDVVYLKELYPILKQQLIEQNREHWLDDEFELLCQPELYITRPEDAWKKLKGINKLRPRQLAAAMNIAEWRETVAIKKDRPRRWILADDIVLAASQLLAKDTKQLSSIANIKPGIIEHSGEILLNCIKKAIVLGDDELPNREKPKRLTPNQEVVADLLLTQLKLIASEQSISPANIANRKAIEKLIMGEKDIPLLQGWRFKIAGEQIHDLLLNKTALQIKDNKVVVFKVTQ